MTQNSKIFSTRLLLALAQAIALYLLTDAAAQLRVWPATEPLLFTPLFLVSVYGPLVGSFGLGQIGARPLAAWMLAATVVVAGLGYHDAARMRVADGFLSTDPFWPSMALWLALSAGLFIAHVLVIDAVIERRPIPSYPRHFDTAWKLGVQVALATVFVGIFWGVLYLGAGLFKLVDVDYFRRLIDHRWFAYPATTLALAVSIHVTDVQPSLIRGARSLILTLFSWLLPLLTIIIVGFLASLPFISLTRLWKTHFATSLLLTAAGLLVFLINCCYQDGDSERTGSRFKRIAATGGSLALLPLIGLAAAALALRVGQHGWTADRVSAAAIVAVAACYAIGYATATVWTSAWLKRIEPTNSGTAYLILVLILALFSPVADPARLMVANQIARLRSGAIEPDKFDYATLKFDGARWGMAALAALSEDTQGADAEIINAKAKHALAQANRWSPTVAPAPAELADHVTVYPADKILPASFYDRDTWPFPKNSTLACLGLRAKKCTARFISLHPGEPETIVFLDNFIGYVFTQNPAGQWIEAGRLANWQQCANAYQALESGNVALADHPQPDLVIGNQHIVIAPPPQPCGSLPK